MSLRWGGAPCASGVLVVLVVLALFLPTSFLSVGRATQDGHSYDPRGRQNTRIFCSTFSVRRRPEKYVFLYVYEFLNMLDDILMNFSAQLEVLKGPGHQQAPSGSWVPFGKQAVAK